MLGSLGATVLFRGATPAWPLAGSRASKLTVRDRLVLPPTRPSVPQRSTATPPPRPAIQPAWVPPSRTQPPIWLRLREVRDEEAPHSRKVRPRAQRQPNTSPNQQLRRAGLPRRQTSTQPRVCKTGTVDAVQQHQIARPGVWRRSCSPRATSPVSYTHLRAHETV